MTKLHTSNYGWDDLELGLRLVSASVAAAGAIYLGPVISATAAQAAANWVTHFHGEAPVVAAKMGAVAASWGFVLGAIFGASGWLRFVWLPKLHALLAENKSDTSKSITKRR